MSISYIFLPNFCLPSVFFSAKAKYPQIFHPYYAPLENIPCDYFSGRNWTFITISTTLLQYVLICKSMIITVGMKENFGSIVE